MKKSLKVLKIGGQLLQEQDRLEALLRDFVQLEGPKILVHGGGPQASQMAKQLDIPVRMHNGRRLTDHRTMEVLTMAYAGLNKQLTARLLGLNCKALGLSGADNGCITANRRPVGEIDYGYVGDIHKVDTDFINSLLNLGITPIFSALSCTSGGELLNTNADSVATQIAVAMAGIFQVELYFCFEKNGVLRELSDPNSVIEELNEENYLNLKKEGIIADGMLPKLENCFQGINQGIRYIYLGNEKMLVRNSKSTKILSS